MSDDFPAVNVIASPHPDDKEYHLEEGRNCFPAGLVINCDCLLHQLYSIQPADERMSADNGPRAMTEIEVRSQVLDLIRNYAQYWADLPDQTVPERCDGLGFSRLNIFDGTSSGLPAFDLVTRPRVRTQQHGIVLSPETIPDGMCFNDADLLHEQYHHH